MHGRACHCALVNQLNPLHLRLWVPFFLPSLLDPVAFGLDQGLDARREFPAEALDVKSLVNVLTATLESFRISLAGFFPRLLRNTFLEPVAHPRYSSFMKKNFL